MTVATIARNASEKGPPVDHLLTETPEERGRKMLHNAGYRAEGGKVTMPRVRRVVKRALVGHEDAEHGGEHKPIKVKSGGAVKGEMPRHRPDRRARRADGGKVNEDVAVDRRYEAEGIDQPHGPEKRADGGAMGGGKKRGGGPKTINVIVGKGDDGDQKAQMAHQVGMQQGVQVGAHAAMQKMAGGAGGGPPPGPPRPPMAPPPAPGGGMPPPGGGGMAGGPPMAGAPRPPGMMAKDGGTIRVKAHERRKAGGSV